MKFDKNIDFKNNYGLFACIYILQNWVPILQMYHILYIFKDKRNVLFFSMYLIWYKSLEHLISGDKNDFWKIFFRKIYRKSRSIQKNIFNL